MPPTINQSICPAGFQYRNRRCYRCPQDYTFCNNQCIRGSDCSSSAPPPKVYNIINNIEPINNTVVNINNITNPVHLNNINTNNIFVYTETECRDGSIRTTMIKNNETINGCVDKDEPNETEEEQDTLKKCCEIITPKQCRQKSNKWICAHKKYRYCGHFCIADKMYLKPSGPSYQHQVLTMPPPQYYPVNQCMGRNCPPVGKFTLKLLKI